MFPNEQEDNLLLCGGRDMTLIREKASTMISRLMRELARQSELASEIEQVNLTHGGGGEKAKSVRVNAEDYNGSRKRRMTRNHKRPHLP